MDAADKEKARRKDLHRRSMQWTGGMIAASALAAAWVGFAPGGMLPSFLLFSREPSARPETGLRRGARPLARWGEFSARSLAQAKAADRPVLLSLSAAWSRPCRLMDETTFADARVAALIESQFVAVRVDPDERPDLALRYLSGGWPTTAFLLPTGEVLDSGTFMPPEVFLSWARTLGKAFGRRRSGIEAAAQRARARRLAPEGSAPEEPGRALQEARKILEGSWGEEGALFARFDRLAALERLGQPWTAAAARRGLAAALRLEDPVWGGFFRAGGAGGLKDAEKRLEDQAEALSFLARADPEVARRTRDYVDAFLRTPEGGWFAGQDPEVLRPDGTIIEGARYFALDDNARRRLGVPAIDRRLFCSGSARMAAAFLDDPGATAAQKAYASAAVDRLWAEGREGGLARRAVRAGARALLDDQLALLEALLAQRRAGSARALTRALELVSAMERELLDARGEAFYDRPARGEFSAELDRIRFAGLNARARRAYLGLARMPGVEPGRAAAADARARALGAWLSSHRAGLDAADRALLAAGL